MRHTFRAALAVGILAGLTSLAQAKVKIAIDLDTQTMHVEAGEKTFNWKVSSGKFGYETPAGEYKVLWTDKNHFSDTYDKAPMPNAIFFAPGYAIHGASKSSWGHPASHGCVRLPVGQSAILFDMVQKQGAEITLTGGSEGQRRRRREAEAPRRRRAAAGRRQCASAGRLRTGRILAVRIRSARARRLPAGAAAAAAGHVRLQPGLRAGVLKPRRVRSHEVDRL